VILQDPRIPAEYNIRRVKK